MSEATPTVAELLRHAGFVRAVALAVMRSEAAADDVEQETWVRALERPPLRAGNLRAWLGTVARNVARRWARGEGRRARRERAAARPEAVASTADVVLRLELQRRLADALLALPEALRVVVVRRFYDGLSLAELARRECVSASTLERRLDAALQALRARLSAESRARGSLGAVLAPLGVGSVRPSIGAAILGGVAMGTKTTLGLSAALVALSVWAGWTLKPEGRAPAARVAASPDSGGPVLQGSETPTTPATPAAAVPSSPAPAVARARTPDEWLQLIDSTSDGFRLSAIYAEMCALEASEGRELVRTIFQRIEDPAKRRSLLGGFWSHAYHFAVLDLASRDADLMVQNGALQRLSTLLAWDVASDLPRYRRWHDQHPNRRLDEAMEEAVHGWVTHLGTLRAAALEAELKRALGYLGQVRITSARGIAAARASGLADLLATWRGDASQPESVRGAGLEMLAELGLGEDQLRVIVLPYLSDPRGVPEGMFQAACALVGAPGHPWAVEPLIAAFELTPRRRDWWAISRALSDARALAAVPTMIGVIEADGGYDSIYGVGYFGLGRLLNITYDKSHDGAWWRRWWESDRERVPQAVRAGGIPTLRLMAPADRETGNEGD